VGAQLSAKGSVGHEVNRATQQIFEKEKYAEVSLGCGWAIKRHQYIDIARFCGFISSEKPE